MKPLIYSFVVICGVFVFACSPSSVIASENMNSQRWQEDVSWYRQQLIESHIDIYNKVDAHFFNAEVDRILSLTPTLNDWEIAVALMRLTRLVGDGHTAVSTRSWEKTHFPIYLRQINGQWRVVKVASEHAELLGLTLQSIDGRAIAEIENKLSDVVQFVENEHSLTERIGEYIGISELLYALDITKNPDKADFAFRDSSGAVRVLTLSTYDATSLKQQSFSSLPLNTPNIAKPSNAQFDYLWFSKIENSQALYIEFSGYPSLDAMLQWAEALVEFMTQNATQQIIIDMRNNGGGDLYVGLVLANALNLIDSVDWHNGVYVLTSGATFSAGTSNAALFKQLLNAIVVGTPTGSNSTGYQDMGEFTLPYSGLHISYSKRFFGIQPANTKGVQPDILIAPEWDDMSKGIDTVLSRVLQEIARLDVLHSQKRVKSSLN
jgi:hypothetical protein